MYAMICIRPNLAQGVSVVSKFLENPGRQYWDAVKLIFIYSRSTINYGIVFGRKHDELSVIGYVDADYADDLNDRRSTAGYLFILTRRPICWRFMIQSLVALFTTESEYIVVVEAAKEAL